MKKICMHKEIKSRIIHGILATICFRMFCLPIYYLTTHRINNTKVKCFLFFNLVSHIKEEHRLREIKDCVLREIFASKMGEVTGNKKKKTCGAS